jgi:1,4-dihydroxy-2-naphthoate octaprenyltransferase
MSRVLAVVRSLRLPFLLLSVASIALGTATAFAQHIDIAPSSLAWVTLAALSAHASVNLLNEYQDFQSGIDLHTERTAFSGGSGGLPANPQFAQTVLYAGIAALLLCLLCGAALVQQRGPVLLAPGVLGVFLVLTYTRWLNRAPWLCLIAPGLGIGFCMMLGTHLALGGTLAATPLPVATLLFALCNNLLLLNQYPDLKADSEGGRQHLIIAHGIDAGNAAYFGMLLLAVLLLTGGIVLQWLPLAAGWAGFPLVMMAVSLYGAIRHRQDIGKYPIYLALNVGAALLTPAVLAGAIITAA